MSDYQWKEKQIRKAHESHQHEKGWLNARAIRSGIPAADVRQLMKIMVERGYAFDNQTSHDSDRYKICFNLDEKERTIEELQYSKKDNLNIIFDTSLLSDPRLADLPPEYFLEFAKTSRMRFCWNEIKIECQEIYKGFLRCQDGGDMQDCQYIYENFLPVDVSKQQMEDIRIRILSQTNTFISMYKSLKIGWQEIKYIYPIFVTYNDLFLEILSAHYCVKYFVCVALRNLNKQIVLYQASSTQYRSFRNSSRPL